MTKPIVSAVALIGACLLLPTAARANDYSAINHYCYMVDGAGNVVNLSHMCINRNPLPASNPTAVAESRPALSGVALEEALNTAAVLHADTFCEARARGGTKREADEAAVSAMASYMVSTGIPSEALSGEFIARTDEISVRLCPELQPTGNYT